MCSSDLLSLSLPPSLLNLPIFPLILVLLQLLKAGGCMTSLQRLAFVFQSGTVIGGRLDPGSGPLIEVKAEDGSEAEAPYNDLGRLMSNTGSYDDALIQQKLLACTRSLFTPPRPFRSRRGGA